MSEYGKMVYSPISDRGVYPHVYTWEMFMETPVPTGYCIHHIDKNKQNNDILNLVCMEIGEHTRWHMLHMTEETRNKISDANTGKIRNEKARAKYRKAAKKRWENEEYRNKMVSAIRSYGKNKIRKKVVCVETGKIYNSMEDAAADTGATNINKVCDGKRKTTGKLHWRWYHNQ